MTTTQNLIQIKRSNTTVIPTGLAPGELAYSFAPNGNTLWIGDMNNIGSAIPIGGGSFYYLSNVTPGVLVPNQALVPNTSGDIDQISVGDLYIDGNLIASMNTFSNSTILGTSSNTELVSSWAIQNYVDMNINVVIDIDGDVGQASFRPKNDTLTLSGVNGITTEASGQTVSFSVLANTDHGIISDADGVHLKLGTGVFFDGNGNTTIGQEVLPTSNVIFHDLTLTGNVVVQGSHSILHTTTLMVKDPLIRVASDNSTSDVVDIGLYGEYNNGNGQKFTGLFRDATDGVYKLFDEGLTEPTTVVQPPYNTATLKANLTGGTVTNLLAPINVADGGTGLSSINPMSVMVGNGAGPISQVTGLPYQVFQVNPAGVPVFDMIDCGTF